MNSVGTVSYGVYCWIIYSKNSRWQAMSSIIIEIYLGIISNDEDSVRRLRALGIDIVIGNFPDMVKRVLAE